MAETQEFVPLHEMDHNKLPLYAQDQDDRSKRYQITYGQNVERTVGTHPKEVFSISTTQNDDKRDGNNFSEVNVLEKLGSGSFGCVYRAELQEKKVKKVICIKQPLDGKVESIHNEIKIFRHLQEDGGCNQIIECYGIWAAQYDGNSYSFLSLEFFDGKTLEIHVREGKKASSIYYNRSIRRHHLLRVMQQLLLALEFLRRRSVVHLDIKLDNVIYNAGIESLKLIDFGLATLIVPPNAAEAAKGGNPYFRAPEMLKEGLAYPNSDIYSTGVTLFVLIMLEFPWAEINSKDMDNERLSNLIVEQMDAYGTACLSSKITEMCRCTDLEDIPNIISPMLADDYDSRPDIESLLTQVHLALQRRDIHSPGAIHEYEAQSYILPSMLDNLNSLQSAADADT